MYVWSELLEVGELFIWAHVSKSPAEILKLPLHSVSEVFVVRVEASIGLSNVMEMVASTGTSLSPSPGAAPDNINRIISASVLSLFVASLFLSLAFSRFSQDEQELRNSKIPSSKAHAPVILPVFVLLIVIFSIF